MVQWEKYNQQLSHAASLQSKVSQNLEIAGIIYDAYQMQCLEELGRSDRTFVIVGGLSVEFYTQGNYMTEDIDIILEFHQIFGEVMRQLQFTKENSRNWYRTDLVVSVETPTGPFAGDYEEVEYWKTRNAYQLPITSVEDIFADRVRSILYFGTDDIKWLTQLWNSHELNLEFLIDKACETEKEKEKDFVRDFIRLLTGEKLLSLTMYETKDRYISVSLDDSSIDNDRYEVSQYVELSNSILIPPDEYSINRGQYALLRGEILDNIVEFRISKEDYYMSESETGFTLECIYSLNDTVVTITEFREFLDGLIEKL